MPIEAQIPPQKILMCHMSPVTKAKQPQNLPLLTPSICTVGLITKTEKNPEKNIFLKSSQPISTMIHLPRGFHLTEELYMNIVTYWLKGPLNIYLVEPGKARGCSTNTVVIDLLNIYPCILNCLTCLKGTQIFSDIADFVYWLSFKRKGMQPWKLVKQCLNLLTCCYQNM